MILYSTKHANDVEKRQKNQMDLFNTLRFNQQSLPAFDFAACEQMKID